MIKLLTILLFITHTATAQKWYSISKNDVVTMACEVGAGYGQGWREEVLYHPNALFKHFPNLNRNFWDNRLYSEGGHNFDANHVLKGAITSLHLAAVVIKAGDLKNYKGKKGLKILADFVKNYAAYQLGFFLSYNVTHKNKWL